MAYTGKFQVGDTVKIVREVTPVIGLVPNTNLVHIGEVHKVTKVYSIAQWPYELDSILCWEEEGLELVSRVGITLAPSNVSASPVTLAPCESELKFAVGNRVRCRDDEDTHYYDYIDEVDDDDKDYPYHLSGIDDWVSEGCLESAPLKYKVGDTVKVAYDNTDEVFKIQTIDIDDAECPYLVNDSWEEEEDLILVSQGIAELKYKVGDEVIHNGTVDTVAIVSKFEQKPYYLKDARCFVSEDAIKPKVALKKTEPVKSLKVGDRVIALGDAINLNVKGQHGVLLFSDNDSCLVEFDNDIHGHDGNCGHGAVGRDGHCWFLKPEGLIREAGTLPNPTSTEVRPGIKAADKPVTLSEDASIRERFSPCSCEAVATLKVGLTPHKEPVKLVPSATEPISGLVNPVYEETQNNPIKGRKSDRFMKALRNLFGTEQIGVDKSGRFAMSPLGMAVRDGDGKYVVYKDGKLVDVMDIVFDVEGAFYRLPAQEVEVGDVIINKNIPVIVKAKTSTAVTVINPVTGKEEVIVATGNILGLPKFYIKVTNMFGNIFQTTGDNPMAQMLPLMLLGDDDTDMKSMLPLFMMSQAQGNGAAGFNMNSLLPLMLLSDDDGDDKMQTLLMMQMFSNGGLNLFGAKPAED